MVLFLAGAAGKADFLARPALLPDAQRNLSAPVIILFAKNYGHDTEEATANEKA